jgi:hypothetical protein
MQVRLSRTTRSGKTYEYAQLVESYRRESDGMPMHRVIANLGALSALELDNLRTALKAGREGKRVALARAAKPAPQARPRILDNLRYLDVAVLLEVWNGWGLTELLSELIPTASSEIAPASVIAALTLQRGVDPGSKLYATRWFPKSALPELLGASPAAFNNTRVHRALDALDAAGTMLMAKLPRRYQESQGAFASLFLDTTDTWFVGDGPALAERAKTKEGLVQRKIGIVLLCNEQGFPLRWETVSGSAADCTVMGQMFRSIAGLSWVGEAPVVCDRAMGHTAQIVEMAQTGLRFLTALTTTEMEEYAPRLPHAALAGLVPCPSDDLEQVARDAEQAAAAAQSAGMTRVEDDLLVLDLGIVEREQPLAGGGPHFEPGRDGGAQEAMRLARTVEEEVAAGRYATWAAASRANGASASAVKKYRRLRKLPEDVQRDILDGQAAELSLGQLLRVAKLPGADAQREAFCALVRARGPARDPAEKQVVRAEPPPAPEPVQARVTAYFNPERFVAQRTRAQQHLEEIKTFVAQLNGALVSPRSRRTSISAAAAIDRKLRSHDLVEAFRVQVSEHEIAGRKHLTVTAELDPKEWALRRRYDGFTVLVGHSSLPHSSVELCRLYRAKDVVEKDFQVIKSVVEVRPVRHRTDGKVRAHVTLCMLALLLERTLHQKLQGTNASQGVLEILEGCRLNRYAASNGETAYTLTEPTPEQKAILRQLRFEGLCDQDEVLDRITPR